MFMIVIKQLDRSERVKKEKSKIVLAVLRRNVERGKENDKIVEYSSVSYNLEARNVSNRHQSFACKSSCYRPS